MDEGQGGGGVQGERGAAWGVLHHVSAVRDEGQGDGWRGRGGDKYCIM